MDGIPAASLPAPMAPPAGMPPMPPGSFVPPPAQQPAQQQIPKPVGRPNSDPEQQQQREERSVVRRRMAAALPREMQEPRIAIFKLMGSRGMTKANGNRPVFTILLSDLEKAVNEGTDPGEFIKLKLEEKFPATEGRFLWEAQDHKGQKMNDYGSHEIILGEPEDEDELEELEREEEIERQLRTTGRYGDPNRILPPPGPAPDNATHIRAVRNIIEDQHRRSDSSASTMLQLMMTQAEDRRREEAARAEREERRREAEETRRREEQAKAEERAREERREREREQERREEREREQRRMEREQQMQFMKIMMDSMNRPVEDKTTPLLFKMLDSKSERDGTKELFSMFNEASKQSMLMQGEASKHMMAAQAESAKMLISNILGISKQMVEAQLENSNAGPDEDPMDKIGRMFKLFGPAIQAIGQGAGTQQRLVQTQQQIPAQAPVVAQPAQQQRGQPNRKNSPQIPDNEWIKGSLTTIMRLGNGSIAPEKRFEALKWCAENLPEKMLAPIRAGDEQQVLAIGQEGADEIFIGWLMADEANGEFLRGCIADIQRMLAGAFTEDSARASMQAHVAHLQRSQGQPFPQAAPAAPAAPAKPAEAVAPAEPKGPRRAPAPQVAEAVPETKPGPTQPQVQNGAPGNV